ncbi:hypothetical protein DFR70_12658 [Nocardia tenerifensis]|uniref:Uncharacterized protein n=1 Tax=Nocardia tenerifensis TaxID=228006 RepID=A0A318JP03_9NOCA|nr:hypothetical protein [Nocardia tenerifensis]PXX53937.1 hypothetical protein DFR70_12658 [Nocardia tenerifensis]
MEALPESNTPPPPRRRNYVRQGLTLLDWVRTVVNVYMLLHGSETASSATKAVTELAAQTLAAIWGLGT